MLMCGYQATQMIKFKDGVRLKGLKVTILQCLDACNEVFYKHGMDCTVSSMTIVKPKTLAGTSINLQSWHCYNVELIAKEIKTALGNGFNVVIEKDHINVEHRSG